ncbi:MAG: hypothetical protein R3Y44_07140 [Rikenellaceae bacterium]
MNYGRYFTLDINASQLVNGIAVFYYRGLRNDSANSNNKRDKYPIYLHISSEGVTFHLHYVDPLGEIHEHSNSTILSLPISSNLSIKDNLTQSLIDIFHSTFPEKPKDENIIANIATLTIENSERSFKGITYSSLEVFGIDYPAEGEIKQYPIFDLLRKLLLDFIYEMEHSGVFNNAPGFDEVTTGLNENFLFRAIRNKAEYYYQRKLASKFTDSQKVKVKDNSEALNNQNIFIADYYTAAERRWVETIADKRSDATFNAAQGWFADVELEMDMVYQSGELKSSLGDPAREVRSNEFTYRCAKFLTTIIDPEKLCGEKAISSEKADEIKYNNTKIESFNSTNVETANSALEWYLHRYCFDGVLKIWYGEKYRILQYIFTILSLLLIASLASKKFSAIISPTKDYTILPLTIIIIMIAIRGYIIVRGWKKMGCVGDVNIFMPRLFASIITAWFTLAIGEDIFKGFFDHPHNYVTSILLTGITFAFIFNEIGKLNLYASLEKRFFRSLTLMSMAFVYSLLSGLLIMSFFGDTYLERSGYLKEFYDNKVYTNNPEYIAKPEYTHDLFYKTINEHDDTLLEQIKALELTLPEELNPHIKEHLNCAYTTAEGIEIKYGVTLKLISIFCDGDGNIADDALISERVEALSEHLSEASQNAISLTRSELQHYHIHMIKGKHTTDSSLKYLLSSLNNQTLYQEALEHLTPTNNKEQVARRSFFKILIYRDMLFQFAFFAMFIGIFLQLVFEEKPVTEPL